MAGPITSRAILSVLQGTAGHAPITCTQAKLDRMEADYLRCSRRTMFQIKCHSKTQGEHCLWLRAFMDTCTKGILGKLSKGLDV